MTAAFSSTRSDGAELESSRARRESGTEYETLGKQVFLISAEAVYSVLVAQQWSCTGGGIFVRSVYASSTPERAAGPGRVVAQTTKRTVRRDNI